MAIQKTPHTETQQNIDPAQADLEAQPDQDGQEHDSALYEKMEGAQSGGTRAFNANPQNEHGLKTAPFTAAVDGGTDTRTPESEKQGITNRSASEESARQRKVVSERPDALAGVNQKGHSVQSSE